MKTINFILIGFILFTAVIQPQIRNEELKIQASELMQMKRYGEAIDLLDRFVASNPQNVEGFLLRGTCYEKRGDFELAVYDYRTAKKISPANNEVNNKLTSATESWTKLLLNKIEGHKREIAIHPSRPINYLAIGIAYKNLGDWNEAEIWYDEFLKRAEPSADEVLRYTEILAKNNQLKKGETILKKYSERNSSDHRIWSRYGYFLYWLGKFRMAVSAFEESLRIRPFFKEALDGLDLAKGHGYVYTINDTTAKYTYGLPQGTSEYVIDRLLRQIKNNPQNNDLRLKLIDELVKVNRFEEAYQQLNMISDDYSQTEEFKNLYSRIIEYRNVYYKNKIEEFKEILDKQPDNIEALLEIAKYYSYQKDFDSAKEIYIRYLSIKPDDNDARYHYARLLMWNNELASANVEAEILLKKDPYKTEYQLLNANIKLWLNDDLNQSFILFNKVLSKQPDNQEALLGLAYLNLRFKDIITAEKIYSQLLNFGNTSNEDLNELFRTIELTKKMIHDEKLFSYLELAREYSFNGRCNEAIENFEKYFEEGGNNKKVYFELADAYQCSGNYAKAINIYDDLISSGFNDYETLKQRAKIVYWSGDSLNAFLEFKKLSSNNPDDAEAKLYLGDTFFQLKQYSSAREIYAGLLKDSPNSHILKTRMKWLGSEGVSSFSFTSFPTYILVSPQGSYFTDNTEFKYSSGGLGLELGVTSNLSIGISGHRGSLSSGSNKLNFNNLKGSVFFKINQETRINASVGQTYFTNNLKENIFNAEINSGKEDNYSVTFFYNKTDAAFILYSPSLVTNRFTADFLGFNGEYIFPNGLLISGKYSFIYVSDDNDGSQLTFRVGKIFQENIKAGYEYYYYTFSELSDLYWSPQNFEAHSIWADFALVNEIRTNLSVGGKLGIIQENDFLLREFYAQFQYMLVDNFSLQAKLVTGSSSRSGSGYNSTSLQLGVFWTL